MELDELWAQREERGVKRGSGREGGRGGKRVRRFGGEEEEERENEEGARKHRRSSSSSASASDAEDGHEVKRRMRSRSGSKRGYEDVSVSSEGSFDDHEGEQDQRRVRNADSEAGSEDEQEEVEEEVESVKRIKGKGRGGPKRARSTSEAVREGSDDESLMGDDLREEELPPLPPRASQTIGVGPTPRKRLSTSKKSGAARSSIKDRAKGRRGERTMMTTAGKKRVAGEEWVNLEGDRCRMGEDGLVRRLVEVREERLKYKVRAFIFLSLSLSISGVHQS